MFSGGGEGAGDAISLLTELMNIEEFDECM